MKEHQPKSVNWIPHNQYMQTIFFIRSYYELKQQHDDILDESSAPADGQPRGTKTGDPTAQKAIRAERLYNDMVIIERGIKAIPEQYRDVVWRNVVDKKTFKEIGTKGERSYAYWKGVFIRHVGEEKKIL